MFVSLPTGSGKSSYYCLLSRAFDFFLQRTALRESIASSRLCHGPHNFEPRRNTFGNLSTLPKTSTTTCFKSGKTNSLEELNTFLRSDGRRNVAKRTAKYIISRHHNTLSFYSGDNVMAIISQSQENSKITCEITFLLYTRKNLSKYTRRTSPVPSFGARKIRLARETKITVGRICWEFITINFAQCSVSLMLVCREIRKQWRIGARLTSWITLGGNPTSSTGWS